MINSIVSGVLCTFMGILVVVGVYALIEISSKVEKLQKEENEK